MTNLTNYQEQSRITYTDIVMDDPIAYLALGLNDEAGEVAGKVKKLYRDNAGIIDENIKEDLKKELGDVLWYLTQMCTNLGLSLEEIAAANIEKILSRKQRNMLSGSGDER